MPISASLHCVLSCSTVLLVGFLVFADEIEETDVKRLIFKECRLMPSAASANEAAKMSSAMTQKPNPVSCDIFFMFQRLVEVDDVSETISLTGALFLKLNVSCVAEAALKYNATYFVDDSYIITNVQDFWRPPIVHENSRSDYGLAKDVYTKIVLMPFGGLVYFIIGGYFTSSCTFRFERFPFDVQNCSISINIWQKSQDLHVNNSYTNFVAGKGDGFISENLGWRLLGRSASHRILPFPPLDYIWADFSIKIYRRPFYFMMNIVAPCFILTVVQLATFFISPEDPERASFAVTVLLSFTVILSSVQSSLPKTPKNVLLNNIVIGEMLSAMLITVYATISCAYFDSKIVSAERKVSIFRHCWTIRTCRLIDAIAFLIHLMALFTLNLTVALLMLQNDD